MDTLHKDGKRADIQLSLDEETRYHPCNRREVSLLIIKINKLKFYEFMDRAFTYFDKEK